MTENGGQQRSYGERRAADTATHVMLARLESKIDVALAQHGAELKGNTEKIARLEATVDKIEDRPVASPEGIVDHEHRLRVLESQTYISRRELGAWIVGTITILATANPFLERLYTP